MPKAHRKKSSLSLAIVVATIVVLGLLEGAGMAYYSSARHGEAVSEIAEVEKFESATRAFKEKYSYMPGDLPAALVMQLKFRPRSGERGRGDGNGLVEGFAYNRNRVEGGIQTGEPFLFWEDLNSALMISEPFTTAGDVEPGKDITDALSAYIPAAKTGDARNRIYVYSRNNDNYFGVSAVKRIDGDDGALFSTPGFAVQKAYNIDRKIDDGSPTTGNIVARYVNEAIRDAANSPMASAASCYDTSSDSYSLDFDGGKRVNCGLSFKLVDQ